MMTSLFRILMTSFKNGFFPILLWLAISQAQAQPEQQDYDVKAHYDKAEYYIPMRDGKKMLTAVYRPKDRSQNYPILLFRTPYSIKAYGDDFPPVMRLAPSVEFLKSGYIIVLQDVRGTYKSEGEFKVMRPIRSNKDDPVAIDASTDNYDTIEWLLSHTDGHNGKVGQWGISYPGWTTVMGMVDAHPALVASSPQASPADMFIGDDWHHNGAFRLMYAFAWMNFAASEREKLTSQPVKPFDYGTPWGYEFFLNAGPISTMNERFFGGAVHAWQDFIEHPNYDAFWKRQAVLPYMKSIDHAVLNVAGWFDAEDFYGPISIYKEIEKTTPINQSSLVVGPWRHGGWLTMDGAHLGDIQFDSKTSEYYQKNIVFPFFEFHLKGKGNWDPAEAIVFETGNNHWHRLSQWPPKQQTTKQLYLREGGRLSFKKPTTSDKKASEKYVSDPSNPVPFSTEIVTEQGHNWMIADQRLSSTRPDVLTYRTEVLQDDITIAGPIMANLFASVSGTDADFFVKLIDVYPNEAPNANVEGREVKMGSYQMLVGVEAMRAKYRDNMSSPTPLEPGKITPISFAIWDKFHTFKKGHRIMVQLHSSWFPAYDRNPQKFMNIYQANDTDFSLEEHIVYHSKAFSSHLSLPIYTGHTDK